MKINRSTLACGLLAVAMTFSLSARAETNYQGDGARGLPITYQVGDSNSVVGQVTNNTDHTINVWLEFKGYAADGHVSQGGASGSVNHLDPGESARFKLGGFFEMIKSVKLVTLVANR